MRTNVKNVPDVLVCFAGLAFLLHMTMPPLRILPYFAKWVEAWRLEVQGGTDSYDSKMSTTANVFDEVCNVEYSSVV